MSERILIIVKHPSCCQELTAPTSPVDVIPEFLNSVAEALVRVKAGELRESIAVIVDFDAACAHVGTGETTLNGGTPPLKELQSLLHRPESSCILGITSIDALSSSMKTAGCNAICSPNHIGTTLYKNLPLARKTS